MEIKQEEPQEKKTPQMLLGIVPCLHPIFLQSAWGLIKPEVEKMVEGCMGEYTVMEIWRAIYYGGSHLYMAYMDESGTVTGENAQAFVLDRISREPKKDFVGFMIVRVDPQSCHLWQGYVSPRFAGTNSLAMGIEYLKEQVKQMGAPYLSFASYREGWDKVALKLGFEKTYSVYRCKLE